MLSKYIRVMMVVSVVSIVGVLIFMKASYSEAQTQSSYVQPNENPLQYCPAELSNVFPIICVNDGTGNCAR